jgi:uncharacterized OsmC-like protein
MKYSIKASSIAKVRLRYILRIRNVLGSPETADSVANPAELFLGSFAACALKNVERFSIMMNFDYSKAEITVSATRLEKPPRMDEIIYELSVYSQDSSLNIDLLHQNIENFGTIFNTVKASCSVMGEIKK